MGQIPPIQTSQNPTPGGKKSNAWVWVLVGLAGMCVVCAIVGAAIIFPALSQTQAQIEQSVSSAAPSSSTAPPQSSLKNPRDAVLNVTKAMLLYSADHDELYPTFDSGEEVSALLKKYLKDPKTSKDLDNPGSFTWNANLSGKAPLQILNLSEVWMVHTTDLDSEGKYDVGFSDGHCKWLLPEELDKTKTKTVEVLKASGLLKDE